MTHVACGVWHTAAVASEPLEGRTSSLPMSELNYMEGEAIRQKLGAAYHDLDQVTKNQLAYADIVACPCW